MTQGKIAVFANQEQEEYNVTDVWKWFDFLEF